MRPASAPHRIPANGSEEPHALLAREGTPLSPRRSRAPRNEGVRTEHFLPAQHRAVASPGSFCLKTPAIAAVRSPATSVSVRRRDQSPIGELRGQGEPAIGSERQAACTRQRKSLHEAVVTVGAGHWIRAPGTVTTSSVSAPPQPFYSAIILTWRDVPSRRCRATARTLESSPSKSSFVSAVFSSAGRCRNRRVGLVSSPPGSSEYFQILPSCSLRLQQQPFFGMATLPTSGRTPNM